MALTSTNETQVTCIQPGSFATRLLSTARADRLSERSFLRLSSFLTCTKPSQVRASGNVATRLLATSTDQAGRLCKAPCVLQYVHPSSQVTCIQPGNVATPLLATSTDEEALKEYGTPSGAKVCVLCVLVIVC